MRPAPRRPGEHVAEGLLHRQDQAPQQPASLGDAQGHPSPQRALKAVKRLLGWQDDRLFFNISTAMTPARRTVSRARAPIARVIGRYHPVQLRTSS
jgi:hypothetical protein